MARSQSSKKHIRVIGKTGNVDSPSYFLTLPIDIVRDLGWHEGKKVAVRKNRGKVVIEDSSN
jgi:hypothetical protein